MSSFQLGVTRHRRAAARFVGKVRRALQKAVADNPDVTQTQIAETIGVGRSVISRQLRGNADMSLSRVAEIAQILGYDAEFELVRHEPKPGANHPVNTNQFKTKSATTAGVSKSREKQIALV